MSPPGPVEPQAGWDRWKCYNAHRTEKDHAVLCENSHFSDRDSRVAIGGSIRNTGRRRNRRGSGSSGRRAAGRRRRRCDRSRDRWTGHCYPFARSPRPSRAPLLDKPRRATCLRVMAFGSFSAQVAAPSVRTPCMFAVCISQGQKPHHSTTICFLRVQARRMLTNVGNRPCRAADV
jgi:hypothetical protein